MLNKLRINYFSGRVTKKLCEHAALCAWCHLKILKEFPTSLDVNSWFDAFFNTLTTVVSGNINYVVVYWVVFHSKFWFWHGIFFIIIFRVQVGNFLFLHWISLCWLSWGRWDKLAAFPGFLWISHGPIVCQRSLKPIACHIVFLVHSLYSFKIVLWKQMFRIINMWRISKFSSWMQPKYLTVCLQSTFMSSVNWFFCIRFA